MRIWNEVSTLILFSIVFLVILKNAFNWKCWVLNYTNASVIKIPIHKPNAKFGLIFAILVQNNLLC